jgi:hypothetical protein
MEPASRRAENRLLVARWQQDLSGPRAGALHLSRGESGALKDCMRKIRSDTANS